MMSLGNYLSDIIEKFMMSFKNQLDDANNEQFFLSITDFCARKYYKRLSQCKVKLRIYSVEKKI